jgi:hypothetical protein
MPTPSSERRFRPKRIFLKSFGKFLRQELQDLLRLGRAALVIDARVNVLGVLAEDDHVHLLRMLHGRGDAGEPYCTGRRQT